MSRIQDQTSWGINLTSNVCGFLLLWAILCLPAHQVNTVVCLQAQASTFYRTIASFQNTPKLLPPCKINHHSNSQFSCHYDWGVDTCDHANHVMYAAYSSEIAWIRAWPWTEYECSAWCTFIQPCLWITWCRSCWMQGHPRCARLERWQCGPSIYWCGSFRSLVPLCQRFEVQVQLCQVCMAAQSYHVLQCVPRCGHV